MNFVTLLQRLTEFIQTEASTETVIGEAFQLWEFTCVPVVDVGFGSGEGEGVLAKTGKGQGGGVGAGTGIDPIGFLVTEWNEISFIGMQQSKGLSSICQQVPDLIKKVVESKQTSKVWRGPKKVREASENGCAQTVPIIEMTRCVVKLFAEVGICVCPSDGYTDGYVRCIQRKEQRGLNSHTHSWMRKFEN